jgi:periplasmic copper chaperone A
MKTAMAILSVLIGTLALAATPTISVVKPTAIASIPGAPTAVIYLQVRNDASSADRLLGASTPLARKVELHTGSMSGGMATMRPVDGFDVAAGGVIEFASGGNHLMLIGLLHPLQAGMKLPLTLKFQKAGDVKINVPVVALFPER